VTPGKKKGKKLEQSVRLEPANCKLLAQQTSLKPVSSPPLNMGCITSLGLQTNDQPHSKRKKRPTRQEGTLSCGTVALRWPTRQRNAETTSCPHDRRRPPAAAFPFSRAPIHSARTRSRLTPRLHACQARSFCFQTESSDR